MPSGREHPSLVVAHAPDGPRRAGIRTVFSDESQSYLLSDNCTVRPHIAGLDIDCPAGVRVDGVRVTHATIGDRQVIRLDNGTVYVFAWHPEDLALRIFRKDDLRGFGEPDAFGWIAESAEGIRFRDACAIAAQARGNVLVEGESGTGKGIVAPALVAMSRRAQAPVVVCTDGNVPALDDIRARADGGTLIVDPIDTLGPEAQARFLHLARTQRKDSLAAGGDGVVHVRIIALARKLTGAFGDDVRLRLEVPLAIPSFRRRLEDVALVLRARAKKLAQRAPALAAPFLDADGEVRLTAAFVEGLLLRIVQGQVFPLEQYLWRAMEQSGHTGAGPNAVDHVEDGPSSLCAGEAVLQPARTSATPPSDPARGLARRLGLPQASGWLEVRIRVIDGHTLLLSVGEKSARCSFFELGLGKDSRAPMRAWNVLIAVCEGRGTFRWQQFGDVSDTVRKQVDAVKAALRAAFQLAEDPFEDFSPRRGWVARFRALPAR